LRTSALTWRIRFAPGNDIADLRRPREVGHFLPDVPEGSQRVQSNDVTTDDRGLFYLLDRLRGLTILERCIVR
jgi:hypothetical protein